jgi:hypothetical protein
MIRGWLALALAVPTLVLAGVLGFASPAYAKGPTDLVIYGPGLDRPIMVGPEEDRKPPLVPDVLDASGGAQSIYQTPVQRDPEHPAGELGPRYTLVFTEPGGILLVQDVYPFALAGPLSYTLPGQIVWGDLRISPGWYQAPEALRAHLMKLGVPTPGPSSKPTSAAPTTVAKTSTGTAAQSHAVGLPTSVPILWLGAVGVATAAAGFGAGALVARRSPKRTSR